MIVSRMFCAGIWLAAMQAVSSVAFGAAPVVKTFGPITLGESGELATKLLGTLGVDNISSDFDLPPDVAPVGAIKYTGCEGSEIVLLVGKIAPMEARVLQVTVEGKPCPKLSPYSVDGIGLGSAEQQVLQKFGKPDRTIERPDSNIKTIAYNSSNAVFAVKDGVVTAVSAIYRNQMMVDDLVARGSAATDAWLQVGDMRVRGKQYSLAREAFENVLKVQPKSMTANLRIGGVYYVLAGTEQDPAAYLAKAEAAYKAVLAVDPNNDVATYNLGRVAIRNKKLVEGRALLLKTITLNPKNAAAYNELGILSENEKKLDDAEKNYRKAGELAPDKSEPHVNLARVKLAKGDNQGAIDEYGQVILIELKSDVPNQRLITDTRKRLEDLRADASKPRSTAGAP